MKDSTAYMMTDMLKDVLNGGTGFNGAIPGLIQAAKTGTSNYTDEDLARMGNNRKGIAPDSTFVGYTTHYAVSVWTGYNDRNTPIYQEYYGIASDVYREIMSYLSQNVSNDDWVQPDSVVRVGNELYVKDAYEVPNVQVLPSTTSSAPQPESSSTVESSSTKEAESSSSSSSESAPLPLKRHHQPNNRQALPQQSNRQHRNNHLNHQVLVHKNRRNHLKVVLNQMKIKQR